MTITWEVFLMSEFAGRVDIRAITPHKDKYPTVHKTFEALKAGEKMELINDHELRHLFEYKFTLDFPDQYEYTYLEEGPEVWRAAVTKIK
jgi:uncharacterized protein (DUF2249 family)